MSSFEAKASRAPGRIFFAVLVACVLATLLGRRMPEPLAVDADVREFSAGRAQMILREIARAPHPAGSQELGRVRECLLERLRSLGFEPQVQRGTVAGVTLANLLVRVPGSASSGTLLCLAHYDSVPSGPGAGDDSIGVASWLETLRALRARDWQPRNDVVFLLSDGEELGMLGARLFLGENPWAPTVATVVNLEAIGNGGPAVLFQLGARNGPCVEAFASAVKAPTGTSLGDDVYRRMPNDTDLTPFLRRDVPGFNIAITTGTTAYHAPHDTPENLDPRSLQHMGECALALTSHLASADLTALTGPDKTFFDVLGNGFVHYSKAWNIVFAFSACALILLATWRARVSLKQLASHAGRFLIEAALMTCGLALVWWLIDVAVAALTPDLNWVAGNTTSGALLFVGVLGLVAGAESSRPDADRRAIVSRACAIGGVWCVAALGSLSWLPGGSFAIVWPLILAAIVMQAALVEQPSPLSNAILALGWASALLLCLPIVLLLLQLLERSPLLAVVASAAALACAGGLFAPVFASMRRDMPWARGLLLGGGALGLIGSILVARALAWRQGALFP